MGQSSSSNRRRREQQHYYPPPQPPTTPPPPANYSFPPPPPPPPPQYNNYSSYIIQPAPPPHGRYGSGNFTGYLRMFDQLVGRNLYYGTHQNFSSSNSLASVPTPPPGFWNPVVPQQPSGPPPPYVEHQEAKTIKNAVNVHKNSIRIELDELIPDQYLVSFTFDALVDGSFTIFYFAKEGDDCTYNTEYAAVTPQTVPFNEGVAQKFRQPSGTGIDLGFYKIEELCKPSNGEIFPLIIYVEVNSSNQMAGEEAGQSQPGIHAQVTHAVIEKNTDGSFKAKVVKQVLWVGDEKYEIQEIFGLESHSEPEVGIVNDDNGKDCVICLSEPRDTACFPCRHLCMCADCAKELRLRSNNCPICRQPIEKLMEIKVNDANN